MTSLKHEIYDNDYLQITLAGVLTDHDRNLLTKLYQPLCGYGPISLYFTLWSEYSKTNNKTTHGYIFNIMQINSESFIDFKEKLEGIGLLKTYVDDSNSNNYLYELFSPLSAKEFLKHELLGTLIKQKLNDSQYQRIKGFFKIERDIAKGYSNISHNFTEIYSIDFNDTKTLKSVIDDDSILQERKVGIIESDFNIDLFLLAIKERKIRKSIITTELIEIINSMVNLYQLSETEIADIILATLENSVVSNKIESDVFIKKCSEYKKMPVMSSSIKAKMSFIEKKTEMLNELEPSEFLQIKKDNKPLNNEEKKLLEDLQIISKLEKGVINVLLDYVMLNKGNELPRPYVLKIASSLRDMEINTTKKAMEYFYKIKNGYSTKADQNVKQKVSTNVIENNSEEEEREAEELKKLKKLIKERKENERN